MKIYFYQIVVPILSLFMIFYVISLYKRGKKTVKELIIWILFWSVASLIAIFPETTLIFAKITGIQDNVNAVLFLSVGTLFFIVFKLVIIVDDLEQKITKIVRNEAKKVLKDKGVK